MRNVFWLNRNSGMLRFNLKTKSVNKLIDRPVAGQQEWAGSLAIARELSENFNKTLRLIHWMYEFRFWILDFCFNWATPVCSQSLSNKSRSKLIWKLQVIQAIDLYLECFKLKVCFQFLLLFLEFVLLNGVYLDTVRWTLLAVFWFISLLVSHSQRTFSHSKSVEENHLETCLLSFQKRSLNFFRLISELFYRLIQQILKRVVQILILISNFNASRLFSMSAGAVMLRHDRNQFRNQFQCASVANI